MNYLLLLFAVICCSMQEIVRKRMFLRSDLVPGVEDGCTIAVGVGALLIHLIVSGSRWEGHLATLPYSIFFAVSFMLGTYGIMLAVTCGPLSLSSLIASFGLALPTLYGLLFLGETLDTAGIIGLVVLCASMVMVNVQKGTGEKLNLKWLLLALCAFLGNGCATLAQKLHQTAFPGLYTADLMIDAMALVVLFSIVIFLFRCRKDRKKALKISFPYGLGTGSLNGLTNFGMVYLSSRLPASILYPTASAGGIVLSWVLARLFYREKLPLVKQIGFFLGFAAVLLMNL